MFLRHVTELLLLMPILVGPLPLALLMAAQVSKRRVSKLELGMAHDCIIVLFWWSLLSSSLALVLGSMHLLNISAVSIAEIVLFITGSIFLRRSGLDQPRVMMTYFARLNTPDQGILVASTALMLILLWHIVSTPIEDYDSLTFHLPNVASWLQHGSFEQGSQFSLINAYPYTWETLFLLFILPFHEDFLAFLPNLVAWGLMGMVIVAASVTMGASRAAAVAAALLLLTTAMLTELTWTAHVDLAFAAIFTTGLYFILMFRRSGNLWYALLLLLAASFIVGIKTSGLGYGGLLALLLTWAIVARRYSGEPALAPPDASGARLPIMVLAIVGLATLIGGFWYAKNFLQFGNPLGELTIRLGGVVAFPGTLEPSQLLKMWPSLVLMFRPTYLPHWMTLATAGLYEFGMAGVVLAVLAVAAVRMPKAGIRGGGYSDVFMLLGAMIVSLVLFLITPASGDNGTNRGELEYHFVGQALRYGLPFLATVTIAAALGATRLGLRPEYLAALAAFFAARPVVKDGREVLFGVLFAAVMVIVWTGGHVQIRTWATRTRVPWAQTFIWFSLAGMLMVMVGLTYAGRQARGHLLTEWLGGIYPSLAANTCPQDRIGFAFSHFTYVFYGRHLDRTVVNVNPGTNGYESWMKSLRDQQIKFIAVGPRSLEFADPASLNRTLSWLRDPNGAFTQVLNNELTDGPILFSFKEHLSPLECVR